MKRTRTWTTVFFAALAILAGAAGRPSAGAPLSPTAEALTEAPSRVPHRDDAARALFFRLPRGIATDQLTRLPLRPQRFSRTHWSGLALGLAGLHEPHSAVDVRSGSDSPRYDAAQRDGTFSSRSTGIPPPLA